MIFDRLSAQVRSRVRFACLGLLMAGVLTLQSCAWYPGIVATYGKQAEVRESPEEPVDVDYDLIKVTPMLVRELIEQKEAREHSVQAVTQLTPSKSYPYRIGPQDVLRVFVWGNPDLTPVATSVTADSIGTTPAGRLVYSNGDIYFPLVGNIKAAGLTLDEFRTKLTGALSKYIKDPQVELDVAAYRSQKVLVSGAVKNPGMVSLTDQPLLLIDAIARSGGVTENADLYDVVLTRGKNSVRLNLDRLYFNGDLTANVLLQNGDVVSVPDRSGRKVYVLGEVGNAAGSTQGRSYIMRRGGMSLTEVLSDAGGPNPFTSAANQIYLMRMSPQGKPIIYQLDAREPQALLLADKFPVQPRDLIFVNPTGPTMIGRFIGQFLPIISSTYSVSNSPF